MKKMEELQLKLVKKIEELTPNLIAFNNEELKKALEERLKLYRNLIYTEEQIVEAKKDRARLNAFAKALNDERVRIKRVYEKPIEKFKAEIDEFIALVDEASSKIDAQVKEYEEKKKEQKKTEIKEYFDTVIGEFKELVSFEKIFSEKWLNASALIKNIKLEIDAIIGDIKSSIKVIDDLENCDRDYIKATYFRTLNLQTALAEHQRLKEKKERLAQLSVSAKEEKPEPKVETKQPEPVVVQFPTVEIPPTEEHFVVKFGVKVTKGQLEKLKKFLIENKIEYFKV